MRSNKYSVKKIVLFVIVIISSISCKHKPESLFTPVEPSRSGILFNNEITEDDTANIVDFYYVYNGGGVAIGDINNDDLPDIYFTGNQVGDKLYINKGDLSFEDITDRAGIKKAGWSTGVTMADINADGLLDIYVCKSGNYPAEKRANHLYINQGDLTFREEAKEWALADTSHTNQAAFFDYDKDGDLDAYLITSTNSIRNPNKLTPLKDDGSGLSTDKLFQNQGEKFVDVSREAGILHDGFGLGIAIHDLNGDGWEDVFVSNDFLANDHLYINNHDGTFSESAKQYFKHHSQFSMGNDISDCNNDGLPDVAVADMLPSDPVQRKKMAGPVNHNNFEAMIRAGYHPQYMRNMLQLNLGKNEKGTPVFAEIGQLTGIHNTDWSWAPLWADLDHDGLRDLFITNGYLRDITDMDFIVHNNQTATSADPHKTDRTMREGATGMPSIKKYNRAFKNLGNAAFKDVSTDWFGEHPSLSNGASMGDLDNDGDLDVVINNINAPASVLENNTLSSHYIKIRLKGPAGNTKGLGSRITIYSNGVLQRQHMAVSRGYQSSVDYVLNFGLGKRDRIDSLEIIWPDGTSEVQRGIKANQLITLEYEGGRERLFQEQPSGPLFQNVSKQLDIEFFHKEEFYMDYDVEPLLLHKLSQQGPCLAVGDINNDGRQDFFVGGSYKHHGVLFIQDAKGSFDQKPISDNPKKNEEDTGAIFLDADNDGDQDLYIVSGSNEYFAGSSYYQDRLMLNDGHGNFNLSRDRLPAIQNSGSCAVAFDFDKDGDLDIFRGGRLTPLEYPKPGTSFLLVNDGGKFSDRSDNLAPGIKNIGMVTDACWVDIDNDTWSDLVLVGEFMPITIFKNNQGVLQHLKLSSLDSTEGFWNTITVVDADNDGDQDLVAGNLGLNSRYRISKDKPFSIYCGDFDNNGRWDALPAYYDGDKEYPIPTLMDLIRQVPKMKMRFQTFDSYAKATMPEIIAPISQDIKYIARAREQRTVLIENLGNKQFKINPLAMPVQRSSVKDIIIEDVNRDGHADIILVGNDYANEVVTGQYDAGVGSVLIGDGKGSFRTLPSSDSGFWVEGDAKHLATVEAGGNSIIVVTQNRGPVLVFKAGN